MSNNERNENFIFINDSILNVDDYTILRNNRINIINALFDNSIEEFLFENQPDYIDEIEEKMLEAAMQESFSYYKTQEKKPNIRLDLKSQLVTPEYKNENCTICNCIFELEEEITNLECTHTFHTNCIGEWVMYKSECPCCRSSIPTKEL